MDAVLDSGGLTAWAERRPPTHLKARARSLAVAASTVSRNLTVA